MLFFDLEFYVPANDRSKKDHKGTLIYNAAKREHKIIGGVFVNLPLTKKREKILIDNASDKESIQYRHNNWNLLNNNALEQEAQNIFSKIKKSIWLWEFDFNEEKLLKTIKNEFERAWQLEQKSKTTILNKKIEDLVTCGFAIGRVDLPVLYIRSSMYNIAPNSELYETFLKTKVIDLSQVATWLFPNERIFYPKSANEVIRKLLPGEKKKKSGKNVWLCYDNQNFDDIEERCEKEVYDIIRIYRALQNFKKQ